MRTYLRYSISVQAKQFPYKAPLEIETISDGLYNRCEKYSVSKMGKIVLIPIDIPEYNVIMNFKETYSEYTSDVIIYEHKFTKKEMDSAEYYLLKSTSLILPKESSPDMFSRCCEKRTLVGDQKGSFIIGKNDMANKVISFTSPYRFFVSKEFKEAVEKLQYTNFDFINVYSAKMKEILAYQLEAKILLPTLEDYNHWGIYKECPYCHRKIHNGIYKNPSPFSIPLSYKDNLKDINATSEVFSEIQAHHYIISRRVYELLLSMGAKKLACEPIIFI